MITQLTDVIFFTGLPSLTAAGNYLKKIFDKTTRRVSSIKPHKDLGPAAELYGRCSLLLRNIWRPKQS